MEIEVKKRKESRMKEGSNRQFNFAKWLQSSVSCYETGDALCVCVGVCVWYVCVLSQFIHGN